MSGRLFAGEWRESICTSDLDPLARFIALVLSCHIGSRNGADVWPSLGHIAKDANLSLSTVQRKLKTLEAAGFLQTKHARGRGHTNTYTLMLPEKWSDRDQSSSEQSGQRRRENWSKATRKLVPGDQRKRSNAVESGAPVATPALRGGVARTLPWDDCDRCGQRRELIDGIHCIPCEADLLIDAVRDHLEDARADVPAGPGAR